jgi:hypothetical protein
MLPMSVNRLDIDIASAEISKPSLIGVDVGESASYYLGCSALAGNSFIEKKLLS